MHDYISSTAVCTSVTEMMDWKKPATGNGSQHPLSATAALKQTFSIFQRNLEPDKPSFPTFSQSGQHEDFQPFTIPYHAHHCGSSNKSNKSTKMDRCIEVIVELFAEARDGQTPWESNVREEDMWTLFNWYCTAAPQNNSKSLHGTEMENFIS